MTRGARLLKALIADAQFVREPWLTALLRLATPTARQKSLGRASRRNTAPSEARKRGHARVVPAAYVAVPNELQEFSFAHHRIGQVKPCEFDLARMMDGQLVEEPVVERPMVFVFERTERCDNLFDVNPQARAPNRTWDKYATCRPDGGAALLKYDT